jgi:hypothetical protein
MPEPTGIGSSKQIGSPAGSQHNGPPSIGRRSTDRTGSVRSRLASGRDSSAVMLANTSRSTAATSSGPEAVAIRPVTASRTSQ